MADKPGAGPWWRTPLLFSLLMGDGTASERLFRVRATELLVASDAVRGDGIDQDGLWLLVSPVAGVLPRSRSTALLEETRLLECTDDRYRLRPAVSITDFPQLGGREQMSRVLARIEWSLDEISAAFVPTSETATWTSRNVRDAIHGGYRWILETLRCDEAGEPVHVVLPAFWSCDGEVDTPVGTLPAVTSVGDSLAALADGALSVVALGHVPGDHAPAIRNATNQLLTYAVERSEQPGWDERLRDWNAGGFMPYDDQPESAHPTVDATWDALMALSSIVDTPGQGNAAFGGLLELEGTLREQTLASIGFLLRMQLDGGGWGIYRYLDDAAPVPPFEFTTGQTLLALALARDSALLADSSHADLRDAIDHAMRRAWEFLRENSEQVDGLTAWTSYFRADIERVSTTDALCSSCWTATGLMALFRAFPDLRAEIGPLLAGVVTLAERHWEPNYARLADAAFRAPHAERLSDTFVKWSNRYDVAVVLTLLAVFNESCESPEIGARLSPELWQRIERTIGDVLGEQHPVHGHWGEPVSGMPLAAATALVLVLLRSYLSATIALASAKDVSAPQD